MFQFKLNTLYFNTQNSEFYMFLENNYLSNWAYNYPFNTNKFEYQDENKSVIAKDSIRVPNTCSTHALDDFVLSNNYHEAIRQLI